MGGLYAKDSAYEWRQADPEGPAQKPGDDAPKTASHLQLIRQRAEGPGKGPALKALIERGATKACSRRGHAGSLQHSLTEVPPAVRVADAWEDLERRCLLFTSKSSKANGSFVALGHWG